MAHKGDASRICLGAIAGAHGIRGEVRIRAFTDDPEAIAAYGPLESADGRQRFEIGALRVAKGVVIARLEGVSDRNAAEALKGTELYVARERLPEPDEDEFYHADLVGLVAEYRDGRVLGEIVALEDFGAGDLVEIRLADAPSRTVYVPFTREAVPEVDIGGGRIVVDPPEGLIEE